MKDKKISIPFSEEDLNELLKGKTFDWNFDGVDVHLYKGDEDDFEANENEIKDHNIIIDENGVWIDDVLINQELISEEKFDFEVRDRTDQIDLLIDWASECGQDRANDKQLMKDDIEYLMSLSDEFIFSAIGTNEYIAKSDNRKVFNDICEDILAVNKDNEAKDDDEVENEN